MILNKVCTVTAVFVYRVCTVTSFVCVQGVYSNHFFVYRVCTVTAFFVYRVCTVTAFVCVQGVYSNVIVIQHHPVIQRKGDRAIQLYCYFETGDKVVTNSYDVLSE